MKIWVEIWEIWKMWKYGIFLAIEYGRFRYIFWKNMVKMGGKYGKYIEVHIAYLPFIR